MSEWHSRPGRFHGIGPGTLEATERRLGQLVRELGGFIREDRSLEMRAKMQQLLY